MQTWATVLHKCSGRPDVNDINVLEDERSGGGGRIPRTNPNPLPPIMCFEHPHPGIEGININNLRDQ